MLPPPLIWAFLIFMIKSELCLFGKYHRGRVTFSLYQTRDIWYPQDLTWFGWCVPDSSTTKLLCFSREAPFQAVTRGSRMLLSCGFIIWTYGIWVTVTREVNSHQFEMHQPKSVHITFWIAGCWLELATVALPNWEGAGKCEGWFSDELKMTLP